MALDAPGLRVNQNVEAADTAASSLREQMNSCFIIPQQTIKPLLEEDLS